MFAWLQLTKKNLHKLFDKIKQKFTAILIVDWTI